MKDINHVLQSVNINSMEDIDHVPQCHYKQVLNTLKSLTANSKDDNIKHIYQFCFKLVTFGSFFI